MVKQLTTLVLPLLIALHALAGRSSAASASNPAEQLADLINQNRTAASSSVLGKLSENAGLACIALQYVHDFQQECDEVGKAKPPEYLLNSTFAAACGIVPSTVATPLSGVLLYCSTGYVQPAMAFPLMLGSNTSKSLSIIQDSNHTQMGVAVASYAGGSPYYWVALFSDAVPNTSFVFSDGKPLVQHDGCFSGLSEPCSSPNGATTAAPSSCLATAACWALLLSFLALSNL